MFMKTDQSKLTFYLQISPDIIKSYPALFTIFMNGRQIQCLWDDNIKFSDVFLTTIDPKKVKKIKITIDNIPKGLNTMQFGMVYFPNKTDFKEENLYNRKYSLDLTSFTIVRNDNMNWAEESRFKNYEQPLLNKKMPVGSRGELSLVKDEISYDLISDINQNKKMYYYWQNSDKRIRKVRFSLLRDWKQIPWPSGELFIDVSVNPGDIFYKEILLSKIINNKTNQISIIAFMDPDKSFWYWDKNKTNDLKATHYGAQANSTLRNIFVSNSLEVISE